MNLIATGFGTGRAPVAPGTFGTLLGLFLYWGLGRTTLPVYILAAVGLIILGVVASDSAERSLGERDSPRIVIDEICGILVTLIGVPFEGRYAASGFLLFRVFDILKPYPIRRIERHFAGGVGIMADDIVAALYANVALHLFHFVPWFSSTPMSAVR